jgi:hypothetical protein
MRDTGGRPPKMRGGDRRGENDHAIQRLPVDMLTHELGVVGHNQDREVGERQRYGREDHRDLGHLDRVNSSHQSADSDDQANDHQ